jgi:protein-tyrosine-phosphatase
LLFEEVRIPAHSLSPKTVFQRYSDKETFDFVVTMCSEAKMDMCPSFRKAVHAIYQNQAELIHWDIRDFRGIKESGDAWMDVAREIRSEIKSRTVDFIKSIV